jgi:hypothetical protein
MRQIGMMAVLVVVAGCSGEGGPEPGTDATSRTIALRTEVTGSTLSSRAGGVSAISAVAPGVGDEELFTLIDLDGGPLEDGDRVQLRTGDAAWMAVGGGGGDLALAPADAAPEQVFRLDRVAGAGDIETGDTIALASSGDVYFVSALDGGGGAVRVDAPHVLAWEHFEITLDAEAMPRSPAKETVLAYLAGERGVHVLAGQHDKYNSDPAGATDQVTTITGAVPALYSADFGFGADQVDNRAAMIAEVVRQWNQGALVQLMYHACIPPGDELCGWDDIGGANPQRLDDEQWSELVSDGTPLNQAWQARLDTLAVYLQALKDAGVAPLFRPIHEMNQGVFWWGGRPGPDGTRRLWQITHDYLVGTKGLDNLIWVWDVQDFGSLADDVVDYDPGPAYWDMAALDIYDGGYTAAKYDTMRAVAGDRLFAIGECSKVPSPAELDAQPLWSFFMLWPDFIDDDHGGLTSTYGADRVVTRDEMPGW